jgi:two-component system cell cycle sensor histidine kinase/response regulator CckA
MPEGIKPERRLSEGTVLIVDDEPTLIRAASRLLKTMGFDVLIATDGKEAIEICRAKADRIDVILLDLILPEMTSVETLRRLRSIRPGLKVILTSGYSKDESIARFGSAPPDGFVAKPFGYAELENAVRAAIGSTSRIPGA